MSIKKNAALGFACLMLLFSFSGKLSAEPVKYLVRITAADRAELKSYGIRNPDIAGRITGQSFDIVLSGDEYRAIQGRAGVKLMARNDAPSIKPAKGSYHSLPEIYTLFEYIALYNPDIARLCTLNVRSWQNRPILALKLSDNVNIEEPGEPEILFMSCHHAREWPTLEITLFIADTLTMAYGLDPDITNYLDNNQIWIVPCVNPDGFDYDYNYYQTYASYAWWRKNCRDNNGSNVFEESADGVDLNRNYPGSLDHSRDGEWGVVWLDAATHDNGYDTYCGPYGMSEPELQAVKSLIDSHDFISSISWHTYTECVMWPWGFDGAAKTEYDVLLQQLGDSIAGRITKQSGTATYDAYQSAGLYPVTGDSDDWLYGYSLYLRGKNLLPFTIEACVEFIPGAGSLDQVVRENFHGAEYLIQQAGNIRSVLKPRAMSPENLSDDHSSGPDFNLMWSRPQSGAVPSKYAVRELSGASAISDGFETSGDLWALEGGFASSSARYHSGSKSLFSGQGDDIISVMTTKRPFKVTGGDSLGFWCWYDTEPLYDVVVVEVSLDGRNWTLLDKFSGLSSVWVRKAYSLNAYAGQYIYIRVRYLADSYVTEPGVFIDDLRPVAVYSGDAVLDSAVTDTSYALSKTSGDYHYLVKAYEAEHGWGDYCQPHRVDVVTGVSGKPSFPNIKVTKLELIKPNPASAPVRINYQLSSAGKVDLSIYDIMGRKVRTLISGIQTAGTSGQATWDGRDESGRKVSSGIYIYRLATPAYFRAYKMILLR
ncbi:MAG: hypothetical protein A2509_05745 [Candidatus Edwardsbacteria bacterium RIFOXYD12_FULL_50_11]|uniref:carboxypeptidase T n=1 Tax=Candidatus Edwardsbacteria bacterium GWF2_54_11 TaxID=1817851 RepID=A0A1F5R4M1_9BACT|nr:MAG: hypothetical protein A2502_10870 [Candidatus Edwardsbacteria bacterium RifOxyC12_full_54_24]OGF06670.1 MAG: hypothetical protein A2273_00195 [Candidatus Edwardsbacteria bacterium RifOxyA12_full_54_48]OGF09415.1 MAG: hypothetical protein A2024_00545 [Candidatus Edwardsbacteria bacterium GWF2_54_11]OGF10621.1 MAG: hypothetical protein A3K15_05560 [Candidatus Edwardsbacteria bacterium GWE2_54_12]OGF15402.1 MAG: hypothetical protein A2509_05745 [Candidatus Edwardsbacteria bacterium RIFOXYD1